uniref:PRKCSH beta subunit of glucosidase II n=1 Tax=Sphenodon punctatus TaxID=8508 RepID=A0A8D0GBS4_SPHPU
MLLLLLPLLGALVSAVEVKRPHHHFYEESKPFTCLDGSATISFDQVNDDYCDCKDGSDEPGTSACPNGRFHCTNAGYRPQYVPSSRVNDGICDCCDTTDEYNSGVVCENTCKEMGRKERETLQQMAEVAREGFRLKQALIDEASKGREEKQGKLAELQEGKKSLEEQVETLKTHKEAAEKPEKEAVEIHQKAWDGECPPAPPGQRRKAPRQECGGIHPAQAELLLTLGSRFHPQGLPDAPPLPETPTEETPDAPTDLPGGEPESDDDYEEEEDDDDNDEDDGGADEEHKVTALSWRGLAPNALRALPAGHVGFDLDGLPRGARSLEKEISFDFGPLGEFAYLYGQCYELTNNEYIYRLCLFNRVSQKPKHGGSETNLGTWGSWAGPEDQKFSVMKYEHGTGCWQGPNRSTTVSV